MARPGRLVEPLGPRAMRLVEQLVQQEGPLGRRVEQRPVQRGERQVVLQAQRVRRPAEWARPPVAHSAQLATQPAPQRD